MSTVPSNVLQTLAIHLLSGQSVLHWWLDSVDANGSIPKLVATSKGFNHTFTISARFIEAEFRFTLSVKIGLFDNHTADRNDNVMSITTKMPEFDSSKLTVEPGWEPLILRSVEELRVRAFHLSDDLKQICPRKVA